MTIALTTKTFEATVTRPGIVLIDWWAEWCGPCRAFAPVFEAASERHPDLTWAKIDTEAEPALASALGIRSIPTLMVFRDGILVFEQPGMLPPAVLEDLVSQVRALDMDEVRRTAEASAAAHAGR
ncbi:MAG: thioredoxin domain-containing protein [Sandaracinaceae bacterium]|nr:thioredoxin domain-containing protein [Sandaracinaceae bacterium]